MEEYNFGELTKKDIKAVENKKDKGEDQPLYRDIFQYTEDNFIELFSKENIDENLKEKSVKSLENQILILNKKLLDLEKLIEDSKNKNEIDKMVQYIVDAKDIKDAIKNRRFILVSIYSSN